MSLVSVASEKEVWSDDYNRKIHKPQECSTHGSSTNLKVQDGIARLGAEFKVEDTDKTFSLRRLSRSNRLPDSVGIMSHPRVRRVHDRASAEEDGYQFDELALVSSGNGFTSSSTFF